jgi:hypothetical protein
MGRDAGPLRRRLPLAIGLILCTSTDREQIELMELHKDNIVVAEYWTDLLPRDELERRIQIILRDA